MDGVGTSIFRGPRPLPRQHPGAAHHTLNCEEPTINYGSFAVNQLTSITIPGSVTNIETAAFEGNLLTSIIIPGSVTTIGTYAINKNRQLTSVTIPDSVSSISSFAFTNSQLPFVSVPSGASVHQDAFDPGVTVLVR